MSRLFPGLVPTDTGTPVTPQRARELLIKEAFDRHMESKSAPCLSAVKQAEAQRLEARVARMRSNMPHFANVRDGELVAYDKRWPTGRTILVSTAASLAIWAAIIAIILL